MANKAKSAPKTTDVQVKHLESLDTTSSKIRYLAAEGYERGDIARILGIRYQWVRNVLVTPLSKK